MAVFSKLDGDKKQDANIRQLQPKSQNLFRERAND